jgi:hypothetical protein
LGQVAISFDRIDRRFIFRSQHLSEETNRRLFLKLARRIETAAVVKSIARRTLVSDASDR